MDLRNILVAPKTDSNTAHPNKRRKRNLLGRDVAVQGGETESELLSGIACGKSIHYGYDLYQISLRMSSGERPAATCDSTWTQGRGNAFNIREHPHLDHGYAVTIHSSQGQTADRVLIKWTQTKANCWLTNVLRMCLSRAVNTTLGSIRMTEANWRATSVETILNAQQPRRRSNSQLFRTSNPLPRGVGVLPKKNKAKVWGWGSPECHRTGMRHLNRPRSSHRGSRDVHCLFP